MGRYLSCGIAHTIYIKKLREDNKNKETLNRIGQNINLNLYDRLDEKDNEYIVFRIKEDIFEKNIVTLIEEQSILLDENDKTIIEQEIQKMKGKTYAELIEMAKKRNLQSFCYLNGNILCNNILYLDPNMESKIFCDIIDIFSAGKILIENYVEFFSYLRKCIIKTSSNPIKTALVITIIG